MAGIFAGKFTFQSTNPTGAKFFLTSSRQGGGDVYPAVLAPAATPAERIIAYAQQDGSLVLAMVVTAPLTKAVSLAWLKGQAALGFMSTDPLPANASPLRIVPFGAVAGSWSVADAGNWMPLCYRPDDNMSLLVFCPGTPPAGELTTLSSACVTPGYQALKQRSMGLKADLSHADLSGLDFTGVDFTGADFTGAVLNGTVLQGATLAGAVFTGASMTKTILTGAVLDGATLSGLDLSSVVWGGGNSALGAHFENSVLVGCHLSTTTAPAKLGRAFFNNADLGGADLTKAQLGSATFHGANLTGAVLNSADLTDALLGGSTGVRPATLAYALMSNAVLTGADLFGVNFTGATLYGAGTLVSGAATIQGADFSNAYLESISFAGGGVNLQGARFDNACLISADFTGAALGASAGNSMPASFAGACLAGATFTGAQIDGVNFANTLISTGNTTIQVRYCASFGPMPPPPATIPVNCRATTGLDLTTLRPATICPNGATLAANQTRGLPLSTMLAAPGAQTAWYATACMAVAPVSAPESLVAGQA